MTTIHSRKPLTAAKAARPAASVPVAAPVKAAAPQASAPALGRDALALSARKPAETGRAPQPTRFKLSALEQMKKEKPDFKNPDEYKNYVIKFSGYIQIAKADLARAQAEYDAIKETEAVLKEEYKRPLDLAQKNLNEAMALYQAPIDKTGRELEAAKSELDHAIWPGKRRAGELDALAAQLGQTISELDRQLNTATHRLAAMDGLIADQVSRRQNAESTKASAESELRRLEDQIPSGNSLEGHRSNRRSALDAADRELDTAKDALTRRQDEDRRNLQGLEREADRLVDLVDDLDRQIQTLQSRMISLSEQIAATVSGRAQASASKAMAETEIRRLEGQASSTALEAQRSRTREAQGRLNEATSRVSTAQARVSRARDLSRQLDVLKSIQAGYEDAVESRSGYKGWVTRRQNELDAAMNSGDSAKITAAKSAYDLALSNYTDADRKVRAMESQMSSYGASAGTIGSVISSKQSELSGLSGADGELSRAQSEKASAQSAYDSEKSKLSQMEGLVAEYNRQVARRDQAVRDMTNADVTISRLQGEKSSAQSQLPGLQSRRSSEAYSRDQAVSRANSEKNRQASSNYLWNEKTRVSSAQSSYDRAKSALDQIESLATAIAGQRDRRNGAVHTINDAIADKEALTAEKAQLPTTIDQLQAQLATKTRDRNNTIAEATKERNRQNPSSHPQVVTAQNRVDTLTQNLKQAHETYDAQVNPLKAKLADEQKTYNEKMSALNERVAAVGPNRDKAKQAVDQVIAEFDSLKNIGGMKKIWWKLVYHFDVDDFWKSQGNQLRAQLVRERNAALA